MGIAGNNAERRLPKIQPPVYTTRGEIDQNSLRLRNFRVSARAPDNLFLLIRSCVEIIHIIYNYAYISLDRNTKKYRNIKSQIIEVFVSLRVSIIPFLS